MSQHSRRILCIASQYDRCEANILAGLASKGFQIHALSHADEKFRGVLEGAGIKWSELELKSRFSPKAIFAIRDLLRREQVDLVHCFSARAISNSIIASVGKRIPMVAYRGTMGHLSRLDPSAWLSFLSPRLNKIICVSDAVRNYLKNFLPDERLVTIRKGHDPQWYSPTKTILRSEIGLAEDDFVVACVANMRPVKGVRYLIEAMKPLALNRKIKLILVGRVDRKDTAADIPPNVLFMGYQDDVPAMLSLSDVFVMPSIAREGLPKALIEAMCVGKPAVVTNVGGMPEVINHRQNGLVVPPRDPVAISKAILEMFTDSALRQKFSKEGRQTVFHNLSVQSSVEATEHVYNEILR